MVSVLKVGHIVSGVVAQTRPDYSAYLVFLTGTEIYAFLPHDHAKEKYRVGTNIMACVLFLDGNHIVLSQVSSQYYRRVAEAIFGPLLDEEKIRIRRIARIREAGYVKIAVENLSPHRSRVLQGLLVVPRRGETLHQRHDHPGSLLCRHARVHQGGIETRPEGEDPQSNIRT